MIMGATGEGKKEFVALATAARERDVMEGAIDRPEAARSRCWRRARDWRRRARLLEALCEVYRQDPEQRCWVHKTANVLNKLPKSVQRKAKDELQKIWMAETRAAAKPRSITSSEIYGPSTTRRSPA